MGYQSKQLALRSVREVYHGSVNDVLICEDTDIGEGTYYTVLVLKDHSVARDVLEIFERAGAGSGVEIFAGDGGLCLAFDYVRERFLEDFYMGESISAARREEICRNLVLSYIASVLPYPFLYLVLSQRQIHLRKDGSVDLGYCLDLEGLDKNCTEGECAAQCALIIRDLLQEAGGRTTMGYRLLQKKIPKQSYQSFQELYTDMRLTAPKPRRRGIGKAIREWFYRHQEGLFRILLFCCILLAVVALVMIFSSLIWGEIPILRLFHNTFRQIGTESLVN